MIEVKYYACVLGVPAIQQNFKKYFLKNGGKKLQEEEDDNIYSTMLGVKGTYEIQTLYEWDGCKIKTEEKFRIRRTEFSDDELNARILFSGKNEGKKSGFFIKEFKNNIKEVKKITVKDLVKEMSISIN